MKGRLKEEIGEWTGDRTGFVFNLKDKNINFSITTILSFINNDVTLRCDFNVRNLRSRHNIVSSNKNEAKIELIKMINSSIGGHKDVDISGARKIILHLLNLFYM